MTQRNETNAHDGDVERHNSSHRASLGLAYMCPMLAALLLTMDELQPKGELSDKILVRALPPEISGMESVRRE